MNKNNIIILGTMHKYHYSLSTFSMKILGDIIKIIEPDIICAELSSDQLKGITTCISKPEYPDTIIPIAKELDVRIVPIQPNTPDGMEWGNRRNKEREKYNYDNKEIYHTYETIMSILRDKFLLKVDDLFIYQSRFMDLFFESEYENTKILFPNLWKLREEWNMRFYAEIDRTIKQMNKSTILVTVGLSHKSWLLKKIYERNDVIVNSIERIIKG